MANFPAQWGPQISTFSSEEKCTHDSAIKLAPLQVMKKLHAQAHIYAHGRVCAGKRALMLNWNVHMLNWKLKCKRVDAQV